MGEDSSTVLHQLTQHIQSLLEGKPSEALEVSACATDEERAAIHAVSQLTDHIGQIHQFVEPLSQGNLDEFTPSKENRLAYPFKELHAQLRHLTWQAERVALGDYHQRVDFMGNFSTAFNSMVEKLAEREKNLMQVNEELEERISERTILLQAANRRLHQADREWTRTFDAMTDRVMILTKDGTIVKVNQAFCKATGLELTDVIGVRCHEIQHQTLHHIPECPFLQTLQDCEPHSLEGIDVFTQDPVTITTAPILDEEDQIIGAVHITHNIRIQKQTQVELEQVNNELQHTVKKLSNVNRELKHLAYAAAHDLRTPLRGISMIGHWLKKDHAKKLDDQALELLDLLHERMHRMDLLIDGVLNYCQAGNIHKSTTDLNGLINKLIRTTSHPDSITIQKEGDFPKLAVDSDRLYDAFSYILNNAIEYMDKPEGHITLRAWKDVNHWIVTIDDNGPGIETQYIWKIFYIFNTLKAKDEQEGVGMGLALAKRIIEAHSGKIWAQSRVGYGTTIGFSLPMTTVESLNEETVLASNPS